MKVLVIDYRGVNRHFYESLQNMEVSKTNNRNEPINMQRKVDYTRQAIAKYSMK